MNEDLLRMSCNEFEELLHDLDRPGTSGLAMRERALVHAESCGPCGLLLIESESLDFALHTMSVKDEDRKASPQVEAKLLREFRGQRSAPKVRVLRWQMALAAVAAMALLALVLMRGRIAPAPQQPVATNGSPTSAEPYAVVTDPQLAALTESEDGTAFVSLPYADDSASMEGGAVVRVTMPRSALVAFGLPIAGNASSTDSIPAEVVVSEDGTPQAIRLISQATQD
jgi:hypothetical protein